MGKDSTSNTNPLSTQLKATFAGDSARIKDDYQYNIVSLFGIFSGYV